PILNPQSSILNPRSSILDPQSVQSAIRPIRNPQSAVRNAEPRTYSSRRDATAPAGAPALVAGLRRRGGRDLRARHRRQQRYLQRRRGGAAPPASDAGSGAP